MRAEAGWPALWAELDAEDERHLAAQKAARAASGLPHGCYALAEAAADRAVADARPLSPRPRTLSGSTRIGVQLPRGTTWAEVARGACPRLLVLSAPPDGRRGGGRMRRVGIRTEAEPDAHVWATVKLHREPPPDAEVKWAWTRIRRRGGRLEAELQLTLESRAFERSPRPAGVGHVEITPCCTVSERGIAVALWRGSDGGGGEIAIPHPLLAKLVYQEAWSSALDAAHATALEVLDPGDRARTMPARRGLERLMAAWCRDRWGEERLLGWWKEWRSERKAANLHLLERPSAGEALDGWWPAATERWLRARLPSATEADVRAWWAWTWVRQSWHLLQARTLTRERAIRQRDELFRREAIRLSTRYETATVAAPRIAPEKHRRSEHDPALREVLHVAGVARCAELARDTFGSRAKKGEACDLLADTGPALRDVLDRAAVESGQKRQTRRRRPERERSGDAEKSEGARDRANPAPTAPPEP